MNKAICRIIGFVILGICWGYGQSKGIDPANAESQLKKALRLYQTQKYTAVIKMLQNNFQKSLPKTHLKMRHLLMGCSLEKEQQITDAKYHFKQALDKGFVYPPRKELRSKTMQLAYREHLLFNQAWRDYGDSKYRRALKKLRVLLNKNLSKKDRLKPFLLIGQIYLRMGRALSASREFRKVLDISPDYMPDPGRIDRRSMKLFLRLKKTNLKR